MTLVALGRFGRPHGVRGEIRFWPFNAGTELVVSGEGARVGARPDDAAQVTVEGARRDGKGWVVRFAGLPDRDKVEPLNGAFWFVERARFPKTAADEVYIIDLLGLPVRTHDGRPLGHLVDVAELGGGEMLIIRDGARERLIPNVEAFVERLDPAAGEIIVRPIEGLLEDL